MAPRLLILLIDKAISPIEPRRELPRGRRDFAGRLLESLRRPVWRIATPYTYRVILSFRTNPLAGRVAEHWSIWVNGNWRVNFRFIDGDVELVDYQDYH